MSAEPEIDRRSDAKTKKILNRLLVVLLIISAIAGFLLRSLDKNDEEDGFSQSPVNEKPLKEPGFDPIPDPIPDPIEVP